MVFRRVLSTYRVIIDRLWAVSPYIFANCCSVGRSIVPSFREAVKDQRKMKPETQTDRNINEGSSQSLILTKVYLLI